MTLETLQRPGIMIGMKDQVEFLQEYLEREFNQADFRMFHFFPWAKDTRTWVKFIKRDLATENVLKTRIEGDGYTTRYFIKGKHIINYLKKYGGVMMGSVYNRSNGNKKEKREKTSAKEKGSKKENEKIKAGAKTKNRTGDKRGATATNADNKRSNRADARRQKAHSTKNMDE